MKNTQYIVKDCLTIITKDFLMLAAKDCRTFAMKGSLVSIVKGFLMLYYFTLARRAAALRSSPQRSVGRRPEQAPKRLFSFR